MDHRLRHESTGTDRPDPSLPTDDGVGAAAVLVHRVGYDETAAVLLDAATAGRSVGAEAIRHGADRRVRC